MPKTRSKRTKAARGSNKKPSSGKSSRRSWDENADLLRIYEKKHGDCNVPYRYTKDTALGYWVRNMRRQMKKNTLTAEKKKTLDDLGFSWSFHNAKWEKRFKELRDYKEEHGREANPPLRDGLFIWMKHQRQARMRGGVSNDQIKRLTRIGFDWSFETHDYPPIDDDGDDDDRNEDEDSDEMEEDDAAEKGDDASNNLNEETENESMDDPTSRCVSKRKYAAKSLAATSSSSKNIYTDKAMGPAGGVGKMKAATMSQTHGRVSKTRAATGKSMREKVENLEKIDWLWNHSGPTAATSPSSKNNTVTADVRNNCLPADFAGAEVASIPPVGGNYATGIRPSGSDVESNEKPVPADEDDGDKKPAARPIPARHQGAEASAGVDHHSNRANHGVPTRDGPSPSDRAIIAANERGPNLPVAASSVNASTGRDVSAVGQAARDTAKDNDKKVFELLMRLIQAINEYAKEEVSNCAFFLELMLQLERHKQNMSLKQWGIIEAGDERLQLLAVQLPFVPKTSMVRVVRRFVAFLCHVLKTVGQDVQNMLDSAGQDDSKDMCILLIPSIYDLFANQASNKYFKNSRVILRSAIENECEVRGQEEPKILPLVKMSESLRLLYAAYELGDVFEASERFESVLIVCKLLLQAELKKAQQSAVQEEGNGTTDADDAGRRTKRARTDEPNSERTEAT